MNTLIKKNPYISHMCSDKKIIKKSSTSRKISQISQVIPLLNFVETVSDHDITLTVRGWDI